MNIALLNSLVGGGGTPSELTDENVYARYIFDEPLNQVDASDNLVTLVDISKNLAIISNLVTNPSFDVSTTGWLQSGTHTISRYTDDFYTSPACGRIVATAGGDIGTNRIRFAVTYGQYNVYKISFWAKSLTGNINIVVTDSGADYQKTLTVTENWQKFEYIFTKRNKTGANFVLFLSSAGSILIDDISDGILEGKHLIHPLINDGSLPTKTTDFAEWAGYQYNYANNFTPENLSVYFVGQTKRGTVLTQTSVFNRLNDIGYISSNVLNIHQASANYSLAYGVKLKEMIIRSVSDNNSVKNKMNNYLKKTYNVASSSFIEKINSDEIISKLTPYVSDSNKFIFCNAPDFHLSNIFLPTMKDLLSNDAIKNKIKYLSCHGDVRYRYGNLTVAQFISNIEWNIHPQITPFLQPVFFAIGNHDTGSAEDSNNGVNYCLTNAQQQANYITPITTHDSGIQIDSLNPYGRYYYRDFSAEKIRVVVLNQYDTPDTNNGTIYTYARDAKTWSEAQLTWLADVALNLPDFDYHVIVYAHEPAIRTDEVITDIFTAFKTNTSFNITLNASGRNFSLTKDFATINNFAGTIVAVFCGHDHVPNIYHSDDIYWITNIGADSISTPDWDRTYGTLNQMAADFVMIDKTERRIRMLRYGCKRATEGNPNDNGDRGFANNSYDQIMTY